MADTDPEQSKAPHLENDGTDPAAQSGADDAGQSPEAPELADDATRIQLLEAEAADAKDQLLRALAEMENLRKRTAREVDEARRYAVTGFARELVEVAENLRRAIALVPEALKEDDHPAQSYVKGVEMTEAALLSAFEKHKISKIEPAKGDRFDHNLHQAMFEVPTSELPNGSIAEVMQAGYAIADRLLRPALVGVVKASTADGGDQPPSSVDTKV